ncbi:hypothetical protein ETAA8_16360 [Anatilimnocola aggregata]|uniref:Lipocalin-like domain-containing protein n=2 Tax=Pirellulaceae TaxID=2691357 RepID=A0A518DXH6_9BACT|nr:MULTISPECIES: hypothetical protein [Pirellulaceae]QDU26556.1 hypothetical protein ETAA8_16360 [Anatilimnocola aggregata]QDU96549.1 hypothetical protein Pla8534_43700 [Lignipirellula cremea]
MRIRLAFGVLFYVNLLLSAFAAAQEIKPAFAKEAQGDWYVLAAHQHNKNITVDKGTVSKITITADSVLWPNPEKADTPLVSAKCVRASVSTDPKKPSDPNELVSTVVGSLCPKQNAQLAARWRITPDNDVLLLLVEVAEYKGNRNGTYSGAAPSDVIFICQRNPLPAATKPDPVADAKRFVSTWAVLGELDDANSARTRPQGNVEFTSSDFYKRGTYKADAKPGMDGTWKLVAAQGDRGRIDFGFRSGIEFQGRSPSLYTFHGDDLLMIVYPEAEKGEALKNPELRQPPTHFGSDGSRNMWILRRVTEAKK